MSLVVADSFKNDGAQRARRPFPQREHHLGDLLASFRSGANLNKLKLVIVTMLQVKFVEAVDKRLPCRLQFTGQFQAEQRSNTGVFVATIFASHVSNRLFRREDELVRAVRIDGRRNMFESDEQITHNANTVRLTDRHEHRSRNEGLHKEMLG